MLRRHLQPLKPEFGSEVLLRQELTRKLSQSNNLAVPVAEGHTRKQANRHIATLVAAWLVQTRRIRESSLFVSSL
jgi:hypothetical protein